MRMWMIEPTNMCRKHLLGEHVELHMMVGSINKRKGLDGYAANNCLEFSSIRNRHTSISKEMINRGYNHKSPLPKIIYNDYSRNVLNSTVDINLSIEDLKSRCVDCRRLILRRQG